MWENLTFTLRATHASISSSANANATRREVIVRVDVIVYGNRTARVRSGMGDRVDRKRVL